MEVFSRKNNEFHRRRGLCSKRTTEKRFLEISANDDALNILLFFLVTHLIRARKLSTLGESALLSPKEIFIDLLGTDEILQLLQASKPSGSKSIFTHINLVEYLK